MFSRAPDARETSRDFINQLDRAIDDLVYEAGVFAAEERRIALRVEQQIKRGERTKARMDCVQIADLRRQIEVLTRYMSVLQQSKTGLLVVSAMDTAQKTIRVTNLLMQQVNARFRGTLEKDGIKANAGEMDENRKKIEEATNAIFAGQAASPDDVLAEFTGEDPEMEALKNFKV